MPKYKARVVETLAQVAFIYIEADSEAEAWEKADKMVYDIPSASFKVLDGDIQVDDLELESDDD